jgi:hypothetical protein
VNVRSHRQHNGIFNERTGGEESSVVDSFEIH